MKKLLLLFAALATASLAQGTPDCQFKVIFTTSGTSPSTGSAPFANFNNVSGGQPACVSWRVTYQTNATSAVSVQIEGAADQVIAAVHSPTGSYTALTPASGGGSGSGSTTNPATANLRGQIVACCDYYPWIRINVNTLTTSGSGTQIALTVYGYKGTSAANLGSGGGGGGTIAATTNTLKGDGAGNAVAVTGTGTNCVLVNGSSSACGSGSGNPASIVTYTPGASVTLTCPSATAGTATVFDPGGVAMAANETFSFASCTAGQIVIVRVLQAASGGPYTVSGLPTGSPQSSTYPSATTVYTLAATAATTTNFVNVAADSGASSVGTGANGISRTVITGTGVTANLLASSDASNPTKYNTSGLGGCGSGVAAYSATTGNTFELYTVPGTVLTVVADGTITAGHLLTGGASTAGRVADTGTNLRTSVAIGTCLVGRALQSATVGNTLLVAYDGATGNGQGAATSVAWSAITNPTGNLSLTMAANTSTWTFNAATGSADLWLLTDTASNTGTGYLARFDTAASSTLKPFHVGAAGVDAISTNASGQVGINTATPALGMLLVASTVNTTPRGISSGQWSTDTASARFNGYKARGTQASPTVVVTGDFLSRWSGFAYDGANFLECASVVMSVQGTVASTRTPGQIDFQTCTDAAPSVLTTVMTITKGQQIGIGTTTPSFLLNLAASSPSDSMFSADIYGTAQVTFLGRAAGGSLASPTQVQSFTIMAALGARGYRSTGGFTTGSNGLVSIWSGEAFTTSANGTYITLETTANGSTTRSERMRVLGSGCVAIGNTSDCGATNLGVLGLTGSAAFKSTGTTFTASGCSVGTLVGGASAGTMVSGTTGTCTVVITLPTAPTGWSCDASDRTTPANLISQTASSTTSCTISGTTVTNDVLSFHAIGY